MDNISYAALLSLDNGRSTGSGFCIKFEKSFFIVTAKHTLVNSSGNLRCETLAVTFQNLRETQKSAEIFEFDIRHAGVLFHPKSDVVIVPFGREYDGRFTAENHVVQIQSGGSDFLKLDIEKSRSFKEIKLANNVFSIGYPTSLLFTDMSTALPLLRKGIVAGFDVESNIFIIDSPSYYGNSGSAVLELCEDGILRLAGVVSRYIPFVVEWKNPREPTISNTEYLNSGYTICTPIDAIRELLYEFGKNNQPANNDYPTK